MIAMQDIWIFISGIFIGALLSFFYAQRFLSSRDAELTKLQDYLKNSFTALSKDALIANVDVLNSSLKSSVEQIFKNNEQERNFNQQNLKEIIAPLKESLVSVDKKVNELENARISAYGSLRDQIEGLLKSQAILHKETTSLTRALNAPSVKGRWGEMQLRRVVELSGLSAHCDFLEQQSIKQEDSLVRPDMIVTLPSNKIIIIDAKVPLEIFGESDAPQDDQVLAAALRRHLQVLKKKSYFKITGQSPEFTVMFLPGEAFLYRALAVDSMLIDYAACCGGSASYKILWR
jgi:DNA recombination protein RmuC